jgi:hypothetical protein
VVGVQSDGCLGHLPAGRSRSKLARSSPIAWRFRKQLTRHSTTREVGVLLTNLSDFAGPHEKYARGISHDPPARYVANSASSCLGSSFPFG